MNEFAKVVLYFTIFSVVGYVWEIIFCAIRYKKVNGRGFLFGPYCPIYGFGGLLVMLISNFTRDNFILTFLAIAIICTALEYLTSILLEKIFRVKWWDYSDIERFNLNGRVCLLSFLGFGIAGCVFVYQVQPLLSAFINWLPETVCLVSAWVILAIFLVDTLISTYAASKAKSMDNHIEGQKDQTAKIKKNCKKVVKDLVKKG